MAIELLSGTGYVVVFATIFLCIVGVVLWWVYNKNQYRFIFELYSRDMKSRTKIKARIKTDKSNTKFRYFSFQGSDSRLEIKEPDFFSNGKPIRRITYDTSGDYIYIEGVEVDDKNYLEYRLKPEHKTLYLQGLKDYANKYPLFDKSLLVAWGVLLIVGIFIVVGFIYTFASNVKQGQQLADISKANAEVVTSIAAASNNIATSSNVIYQAVSLMYNGTITRPLGAVR